MAEDTQFKPGESGNPAGRPVGSKNYKTIYREAIEKIAEAKDMTPEEIEIELEVSGINKAMRGDFKFWEDVRNRLHGKPKQSLDVGGDLPKTLIELMVHGSKSGPDQRVPDEDQK